MPEFRTTLPQWCPPGKAKILLVNGSLLDLGHDFGYARADVDKNVARFLYSDIPILND
jgi:hypothetical protein